MKILTVLGARPQFIKASVVSDAIAAWNSAHPNGEQIHEEIVHTGQHYDTNMSDVFFEEMGMPKPVVTLKHGGLGHGAMTGRMLEAIEAELLNRKPDLVLLYGDTNSTLAGALAAAKLCLPVAHVESGLRSIVRGSNKLRVAEEVNRILTDHVSEFLFCPTKLSIEHLSREGLGKGVYHVGDVMYDAAKKYAKIADSNSTILDKLSLKPKSYILATVHRAENTDAKDRLASIFEAFSEIATEKSALVLPLHPRTTKLLSQHGLNDLVDGNPNIHCIEPVGFIDMVQLERNATTIITDSGGVQKEAYFHDVPCITMWEETVWEETVEYGWNQIVGTDKSKIVAAVASASKGRPIPDYGDGTSGAQIVEILANYFFSDAGQSKNV